MRLTAQIILVGAGGVGGHIATGLARLLDEKSSLTILDGDVVEVKNLERQPFDTQSVGAPKATALAQICREIPACQTRIGGFVKYLDFSYPVTAQDILVVAVDNHPGRRVALEIADIVGCSVLTAANEELEAEAYWYDPRWVGTARDPRSYYPDILTDKRGDPTAPCYVAAASNAQTAIANMMAAHYALWLLSFWLGPKAGDEGYWPLRVRSTRSRVTTATGFSLEEDARLLQTVTAVEPAASKEIE